MSEKTFFEKSEFENENEGFQLSEFREEGVDEDEKNVPIKPHPGGFISLQTQEPVTKEEHFRDLGFIQDHSMISSVEDYAVRVRIDADDYSEKKIQEADQYYETKLKIIETKRKETEARCAEIEAEIKELTEEREKIYEKIKKDAYKEGFREGKNDILDQSDENIKRINAVSSDLQNFHSKLLARYEKDLIDTALLIAGKIIHREVAAGSDAVEKTLTELIERRRNEGPVKLYMCPADFELMGNRAKLQEGRTENLIVEIDEELTPGNIQIESDVFLIDTDIGSQLDVIKSDIRKAYFERVMKLTQVESD